MGDVAEETFSAISRIESNTKDEAEKIKKEFKQTMISLAETQGKNVASFIKAAIICGDFKILKLFKDVFPKAFKKIAEPYRGTKNKRLANFLANTIC